MVTANEVYSARVAKLEADEERDGLDTEEAAVDVVTLENMCQLYAATM